MIKLHISLKNRLIKWGSIFLHFPRFTQTRKELTNCPPSFFFLEVPCNVCRFPSFTQTGNKLTSSVKIDRKRVELVELTTGSNLILY